MERVISESDREDHHSVSRQHKADQDSDHIRPESDPTATIHQRLGNQTVQRLYERGDLQARLEINQPNDEYEREAEQITNQVMEESVSSESKTTDKIRRKEGSQKGQPVDRKDERRIKEIKNGGKPLSPSTRSFFESRFGHDFSDIRIHTGSRADEAARSINAEAFTHGTDIVFREGRYAPNKPGGKRLLAHELTHTIQQGHARETNQIQRQESKSRNKDKENDKSEGQQEETYSKQEIALFQQYVQWASRNYYIPSDKTLNQGNWMDAQHKDDPPRSPKGEYMTTAAVATRVGQEMGEGIHYLAAAMGVGITIMTAGQVAFMAGVGGGIASGYSGMAGYYSASEVAAYGGGKLATRAAIHTLGYPGGVAGKPMAGLVPEDIQMKVQPGKASRLQIGYFFINVLGDRGVLERFLKENHPNLPRETKEKIKKLVDTKVDKKVSELSP